MRFVFYLRKEVVKLDMRRYFLITTEDYKDFLTQYLRKQIVMLGPNVAISASRKIPGLGLNEKGEVVSLSGDAQVILNETLSQFKSLCGNVGQKSLDSLFDKFPGLKSKNGLNG